MMADRELQVGDRVASRLQDGEVIEVCECGCGYLQVKDDKGEVHGVWTKLVEIIDGD